MSPFKCFKIYIALKAHFLTGYDVIKYEGRVSCKQSTFEKRNDRVFFTKLSKRYDPYKYILANLVDDPKKHVADFNEKCYIRLVKVTDSLLHYFERDIREFDHLIPELQSEKVINLFYSGKIEIETLCILNNIFKFTDGWGDNPLFDDLKKIIEGYQGLLNVDYNKIKNSLRIRIKTGMKLR